MLYEIHPVVRYLMTQLEASVDKDVALVSKISRLPTGKAFFLFRGVVANNLGQSILSDLFIVPMHIDGGLADKPLQFVDFLKEYPLNEELYTVEITKDEINQLEQLLPDVVKFAHQLHMGEKQQQLQFEMEKKWQSMRKNEKLEKKQGESNGNRVRR